jgi:hypothetical protein
VKQALSPADRRALELPIGIATDEAAADAWLARETGTDGAPLADRAGLDGTLSDKQRLILLAKIGARESAEDSRRFATVKGLDDCEIGESAWPEIKDKIEPTMQSIQ